MATIKDIATKCGVSIATVSKALNGHDDVAEKTKDIIKNAARDMGYTPNSQARALKTNRTYNLGVIFADKAGNGLTHSYFNLILNGFKVYVEGLGYDVTFIGPRFGNQRMTLLEHAKCRSFDGIAVVCVDSFEDPMLKELAMSDFPVVSIDYAYPGCSAVFSDNRKGISELVHEAYAMGHKKIAYIYGDESDVTNERVAGFLHTMQSLQLDVVPDYLIQGRYTRTDVTEQITEQLLSLPNPPTCILMPDDYAAIGGINAVRKHGLSVPGDVSILGFDGIQLSEVIYPRLTTFRQNAGKIGAEAARRLIADIKKEQRIDPVIIVPGEVVFGDSLSEVS
jgi:DNA-binding LacI/PurR family transcriptional regulator